MKHTPTPWIVTTGDEFNEKLHWIWTDSGKTGMDVMIARTCFAPASEANAAHIVHCVNSHAALLTALKGLLADVQNQKIETLAGEAWIYDLSDEDLHAQMGFADGEEKEEVKQRVEAILAARAAIAAAEPKGEGKG